MLWPVVKALLGHYRRHPLQILLVWLGLTLGISLFVGVEAVNQHAKQSYVDGERLFSDPLTYNIRSKHNANKIPQGLYIQLRREGFNQCVPMDTLRIETQSGRDLTIVGLDMVAMLNITGVEDLSSLALAQPPYPLMFSPELASYLSVNDGDFLQLANGTQLGPVVIDQTGFLTGTRIVADIAKLRELHRTGGFSAINCGAMPKLKFDRLKKMLPNGVTVSRSSKTELSSLTQAFHMNLSAMGMLAFVVGLFIFYQAMSLSFVQRQPLVGILRQTGVSGWQLTQALLIELAFLIIFSWSFGNLLGLYLANGLIPTVSTTLSDLYDADVGLVIQWSSDWSIKSLIMAVGGGFVACAWPMVRLLKTQPIRLTARLSLVRFAGREFLWQALVAIVLAAIAITLYKTTPTSETGFVLIGLMMVCTALLVPFLVFQLFNLFSYKLRWVKVRWFFADAAASMSYRGVALMAFMLAMSANIAVETLVGSFRETTDEWLTQRLAADLYIHPTNSSAARVSNWLKQQDEVDAVWWRWEEEFMTTNGTLQVVSTGSSIGERDSIPVKLAIPNYWYRLHDTKSILVSESMALKKKIRPGDYISFNEPLRKGWLVAGVYYDYGNPYNQVMMSHQNWLHIFAGQGNVGLGVHLKEGQQAHAQVLIGKLSTFFRLSEERVLNNTNIHNQAMRVFDRTFIIADTLGDLTLVIAVFGLFFSTVAGEVSKQRQVALLRCFGISGKELVALSSLQLMLFGAISAIVALPLGYAIAQVMVSVGLKQSFGWSMPIYVIPWEYIETFVWTMAALLVAGAAPVIGMINRTPMKSLRDAL
ncbi:ABC transporter permease [Vibrio hannami]|uniref:ABC transporter permease n=1 Tax=Vibrio hannami TaxID=2717094 RepID=UPI00241091CF|nr:ABC transporter permease [Vibrio hannami]MDG3087948.1 ABC transporter permease [Vibrio hannami]